MLLLEEVEYRLDLKHHPESAIIPRGRVSGVVGLQLANQLFAAGKVKYCIVAEAEGVEMTTWKHPQDGIKTGYYLSTLLLNVGAGFMPAPYDFKTYLNLTPSLTLQKLSVVKA